MSTRFTEILSAEPAALTHPHLSVSLDDTLAQQRAYDQKHSRSQPRSASGSSATTTASASSSSSSRHSALPTTSTANSTANSARTGSTSSFSSSGASADADDAMGSSFIRSAPIEARTVKVWGSDADQQHDHRGPMGSVAGVVGVTSVANRLRKKALGRRNS